MNISKTIDGNITTLSLSGRLDTVTSGELAKELELVFGSGICNLIIEISALEYISSAGLRVLLTAQKKVNSAGTTMKVAGANEMVKEVFEVTGFSGILTLI